MNSLTRLQRAYQRWLDAPVGNEAARVFGRLEAALRAMEPARRSHGASYVVLRTQAILGASSHDT